MNTDNTKKTVPATKDTQKAAVKADSQAQDNDGCCGGHCGCHS